MFRQNNQYHFLKRLEDRAKIVASIHFQNDPEKIRYYSNLKKNGLEELIQEEEFVLKVNSENSFEYNVNLDVPNEFYTHILQLGETGMRLMTNTI